MAEITASVAVWRLQAGDIAIKPNTQAPLLLSLHLGDDVHIVLERDKPGQAAAMRELARLATEAAEDLERPAAAQAAEERHG